MKQGFRIKRNTLYAAILAAFCVNTADARIFADVPLHLQSSSTTASSYSVKPNVTLFIDDSASMNEATSPESYKCKKQTRERKPDGTWGGWSAWSTDYVATFDKKPTASRPGANSPESEYYGLCASTTKMDVVQEILTELVKKHRNSLYFGLQPFNNYNNADTKYIIRDPANSNNATNIKAQYDLTRFYETSDDFEYSLFLQQINGNKERVGSDLYLKGLRPSGGTYTSRRYVAVARNFVMNKLRYRCQKSFIVLMTDGVEESGNYAYTDSPYWAFHHLRGNIDQFDGYFDGYRHQDYKFVDKYGVCQNPFRPQYFTDPKDPGRVRKLAYYTQTVATKSFGDSSLVVPLYDKEGKLKQYKTSCKIGDTYPNEVWATVLQFDPDQKQVPVLYHRPDKDKVVKQTPIEYHPYIYESDYRNGEATAAPQKAKSRPNDEAGRPWNDWVDPDNHTKGRFKQVATTYTIGVGLGKLAGTQRDRVLEALRNAATEANPNSTQTDGFYKDNTGKPYDMVISPKPENFFNANSRQEIMDAFNNVFDNIIGAVDEVQKPITTNTPNFSATSTSTGTLTVRAIVDTATWSSMLQITKGGNKGNTQADAADKSLTPSFNDGNRRFILSDGVNTYSYPDELGSLDNDTFNIPDNDGKNKNEWKDGLLAWLARAKPDDQIKQEGFVLDYRERKLTSQGQSAREMGDIEDNPIISLGPQTNGLSKFVITSANDGLVYVFKYSNDENHPYTLAFNYMPLGMQRSSLDNSDTTNKYFKDLTQAEYGQNTKVPHRYLLNGGIKVRKTEGEPSVYFMASGMGQAGRGIFALIIGGQEPGSGRNVGADGSSNEVTLFHTPQGPDNKFGYTVGAPAIARVRVDKSAAEDSSTNVLSKNIRQTVIAGSGFNYPGLVDTANPTQDPTETALYIYDALGVDVGTDYLPPKTTYAGKRIGDPQGTLIKKIMVPDGVGGLAAVRAVSSHNDGITDIVYAGDYGGNLYRFDLRKDNPAYWTVRKIFAPSAGDHSPITAAPEVYQYKEGEYIVTFGTGSEIYQTDLENKDKQYMYGIYDKVNANETQQPVRTRDQLLAQQIVELGNNQRDISDNRFSSDNGRTGWYIALPDEGERVIQTPQISAHTVLFFTHSYSVKSHKVEDPCIETTSTFNSSIFTYQSQVNVLTGGKLKKSDWHVVWDQSNPFLMAVGAQGYLNMVMIRDDTKNNPGGNGEETKLKRSDADPNDPNNPNNPLRHCLDTPIEVAGNTDVVAPPTAGGLCSVQLRRLSWREVFDHYKGS
ncbi:PilC/PilY family type IV pilus protein [Neisseriaceae bacterium ESL0693]|nr:PilC/PilY family type IV pilus protein [Neisseriaceae bacterium ESL0693]